MQSKGSIWIGWVPLAVLPISAAAVRSDLPAWGFMGSLAFSIYFGFKWLTWWQARLAGVCASAGRSWGYILAWPGMDARTFLNMKAKPPAPGAADWLFAILKTVFGAVLVWGVPRQVSPQ
jgi:hypothetical protein